MKAEAGELARDDWGSIVSIYEGEGVLPWKAGGARPVPGFAPWIATVVVRIAALTC